MRSLFQTKHINDIMLINDLSRRHQYNVTLEINDDMFVSHLLLDNRYCRM
jgi:hypothetical protein